MQPSYRRAAFVWSVLCFAAFLCTREASRSDQHSSPVGRPSDSARRFWDSTECSERGVRASSLAKTAVKYIRGKLDRRAVSAASVHALRQVMAPCTWFLCLYPKRALASNTDIKGLKRICTCQSGNSESFLESIESSTPNLVGGIHSDVIIKIGIGFSAKYITFDLLTNPYYVPKESIGLLSFVLFDKKGTISFATGSQVIEDGLMTGGYLIDKTTFVSALRKQTPHFGLIESTSPLLVLETLDWIEATNLRPVQLYRLHRFSENRSPARHSPIGILKNIVYTATYLSRIIRNDGKMTYIYDVVRDSRTDNYNILRHAGSVYALVNAYNILKQREYISASERAIEYFLQNCKRGRRYGHFGGGDVTYPVEGSKVKLGGAGLGLLMLSSYSVVTGERDKYEQQSIEMATFIVANQMETGEFISFPSSYSPLIPSRKTSMYYPGEAILGLVMRYEIDKDTLWLETAVRGADWLILVRDAKKDIKTINHDHWLVIALSHLWNYAPKDIYWGHITKIIKGIVFSQITDTSRIPYGNDFRGGFYDVPRSTPAATRGEALGAFLRMCKGRGLLTNAVSNFDKDSVLSAHDEDLCRLAARALNDVYQFLTYQIVQPSFSWWMKSQLDSIGGVIESPFNYVIRNDFVQHTLSSMIDLYKHECESNSSICPRGDTLSAVIANFRRECIP